MTLPPRFVLVIIPVAMLCLLSIVGIAWQVKHSADADKKRDQSAASAEERRDCERAVASRSDSRAMWLYLLDTATADPKQLHKFAVKLDELLPALRCEGGNWVPARTP